MSYIYLCPGWDIPCHLRLVQFALCWMATFRVLWLIFFSRPGNSSESEFFFWLGCWRLCYRIRLKNVKIKLFENGSLPCLHCVYIISMHNEKKEKKKHQSLLSTTISTSMPLCIQVSAHANRRRLANSQGGIKASSIDPPSPQRMELLYKRSS